MTVFQAAPAAYPYRSAPEEAEGLMAVPQTIKVTREEGYHTDQIGKYGDGHQFMGFVTATLPTPLPKDWQAHKRWYAVLHTFDKKGKYLNTEAWFAGTTASGEREAVEKAQSRLAEMIA